MFPKTEAIRRVNERGPRYAVIGYLRPNEAITEYADTGEKAEQIADRMRDEHYRQVNVYPPDGSVHLGPLRAAREQAIAAEREATAILRAACLRELEAGRAEAEVARQAGVDRMALRKWAGK